MASPAPLLWPTSSRAPCVRSHHAPLRSLAFANLFGSIVAVTCRSVVRRGQCLFLHWLQPAPTLCKRWSSSRPGNNCLILEGIFESRVGPRVIVETL